MQYYDNDDLKHKKRIDKQQRKAVKNFRLKRKNRHSDLSL